MNKCSIDKEEMDLLKNMTDDKACEHIYEKSLLANKEVKEPLLALVGKNVKFRFVNEEYKSFYGDDYFDGTIVRNGNEFMIESLTGATPEEIARYGYDLFELYEVEYELA